MALSLAAADGENLELLVRTSGTIFQMASIAQVSEVDKENMLFYSHISCHCFRIHHQAKSTHEPSTRLNSESVIQILRQLGDLITGTTANGLPSYAETLESRFQLLNSKWIEARKEADRVKKLEFINGCLAPGASEDQRSRIDEALESFADDLERQQPERPSMLPELSFSSSEMEEPSCPVWKVAQSIFNALSQCKGCSCHSQHTFEAKLEMGTYRQSEKHPERERKRPRVSVQHKKGGKQHRNDVDGAGDLDVDLFLSMEQDWHEVRIQSFREKGVAFAIPGEEVLLHKSSAKNGHARVEMLCKPIVKTRKRTLQRLVLKLTGGQLFEMGFEKTNFRIDKTANPISLSECFEQRYDFFTEKTKRILSLIIGYTVLHLSGTSWLQPGWASSDIKFFQTTTSKTPKTPKTPLRPFIQTQLPTAYPLAPGETPDIQLTVDGDDDDYDETLDELDSSHNCPQVVALAVVLMEVYSVKPFRRLAEMHNVPLIRPTGRITLVDVDQVFNGDEEEKIEGWRSQMPEYSPLLRAIDNCLDRGLWEDDDGEKLDEETLRSRIYQHVVRFLKRHLTDGFSQIPLDSVDKYARDLDFGNWGYRMTSQEPDRLASPAVPFMPAQLRTPSPLFAQPTPVPGPGSVLPVEARLSTFISETSHASMVSCSASDVDMMTNSFVDYTASQFFDDTRTDSPHSVAETQKYLTWKEEYRKVYAKFIEKHLTGTSSNQAVKIAILDTGIDRDHETFEARRENLKGKRNFYRQAQKSVPDRNGHGTFVASLILDYARDAELYVIKITDEKNTRPDADIVAKAIDHAVDEWDVDIISMSFGWPSSDFDGYEVVQAAIDKAHSKKVLMFAAASNSGGRQGRAYPASSSQVICVHSTDTNGNMSGFSPTPEPNSINIATVGESIRSAWPMLLCRDKKNLECVEDRSGTSYATAILAGIAAFLLQYAKLHLPEAMQTLKRKDKMEALLRRCSQRGPNYDLRDGYFYVELSLNKHNLFGDTLDWVSREILKTMKT